MKTMLIFIILLIYLPLSAFCQIPPPPLPFNPMFINWQHPALLGLISWWEVVPTISGGSKLYDLHGVNNCTLTNGPVWGKSYRKGSFGEIRYDGSNDYADCGTGVTLTDIRLRTVLAWVKANSYGGGTFGRIVDKRSSGGWVLYVDEGGGTGLLEFTQGHSTTEGNWYVPSFPSSVLGSWVHVGVTYNSNSTSNDPIFYVNGLLAGTTVQAPAPSGSYSTDASSSLKIGERGAGDRGFDGAIDQVLIFNRILSAKEVYNIASGNLLNQVTKRSPGGLLLDLLVQAVSPTFVIKRRIVIE